MLKYGPQFNSLSETSGSFVVVVWRDDAVRFSILRAYQYLVVIVSLHVSCFFCSDLLLYSLIVFRTNWPSVDENIIIDIISLSS